MFVTGEIFGDVALELLEIDVDEILECNKEGVPESGGVFAGIRMCDGDGIGDAPSRDKLDTDPGVGVRTKVGVCLDAAPISVGV